MKIFARFFGKKKKLAPVKYEVSPEQARKILSDWKGREDERRAFEIVETSLRILIREKVEKGKLGLKGLTNIEFHAGRYNTERDLKNNKGEPGKDIWIRLLFPAELRGEKIDIEVKSSKWWKREHRKKYDTPVVIVNSKIPDHKIAKRMYNVIFELVRAKLKENSGL
ncbi:MAG: hypothetical protein ACOZAL_00450 [Patescibacteria group bacterium]